MNNTTWDSIYNSLSRDNVNSNFVMALVPVPERPRVGLRAGYLMNTGWRPSHALTRAVDEWRKGHTSDWR
jgi:hypothetical protein